MPGKVLILENMGADYGAYFLTRGFADLVGPENVRCWPYKHTNEGGFDHYPERVWQSQVLQRQTDGRLGYGPYFSGSELWADRAYWRAWQVERSLPGIPIPNDAPCAPAAPAAPIGVPFATDQQILDMVALGDFDLVVCNGVRWHCSAALHEIKTLFAQHLPPVALCDHEDYTQRRWDFCDAFSPAVYFKRSCLVGGHPAEFMLGQRPSVRVRPLPFSSMWSSEWVPWAERDIDVFCVFGNTQAMRQKLKAVTLEVAAACGVDSSRILSVVGHPMKHPEYMATLRRSKIVIDQQSFGADTLRFWEAASAGCCLVSDFNLHAAPALTPWAHYYKFDNDLSAAGDQQDFGRFRQVLTQAITQERETENTARFLYDAVRAYHTNRARAAYLVAEMRAAGHALEGLPR